MQSVHLVCGRIYGCSAWCTLTRGDAPGNQPGQDTGHVWDPRKLPRSTLLTQRQSLALVLSPLMSSASREAEPDSERRFGVMPRTCRGGVCSYTSRWRSAAGPLPPSTPAPAGGPAGPCTLPGFPEGSVGFHSPSGRSAGAWGSASQGILSRVSPPIVRGHCHFFRSRKNNREGSWQDQSLHIY